MQLLSFAASRRLMLYRNIYSRATATARHRLAGGSCLLRQGRNRAVLPGGGDRVDGIRRRTVFTTFLGYVIASEVAGCGLLTAYLYSKGGRARESLDKYIPVAAGPFLIRFGNTVAPSIEFAMRLTDRLLAQLTKKDVDSVDQLERLLYAAGPVVVEERGAKKDAAPVESGDLAREFQAMLSDAIAVGPPAAAASSTTAAPAQLPPREDVKFEKEYTISPSSVDSLLAALERSHEENKTLLRAEAAAQLAEKQREWEVERAAERAQLQNDIERQIQAEVESLQKVFIDVRSHTLEEMRRMRGATDAVALALETQRDIAAEAVAVNQRLHKLVRFSLCTSVPPDWREQLREMYAVGSLGRLILDKSKYYGPSPHRPASNGMLYEPLPYCDLVQAAFVAPGGGVGAHLLAAVLKRYFILTGHVPKVLKNTKIQDASWNVMCIEQAAQAEREGDLPAAAAALNQTRFLTSALSRHWVSQISSDAAYRLALRALVADAAITAKLE